MFLSMVRNSLFFALASVAVLGNSVVAVAPLPALLDDSITPFVLQHSDTAVYLHTGILQSFEGYSDTFYVPSPRSGPTIGYGLDIGLIGEANVRKLFRGIMSETQIDELCTASGKRGAMASIWVQQHKNYRLSNEDVQRVTDRMYMLFMRNLLASYPHLDSVDAGIRTAVLSYYMHHGRVNRLDPYLRRRDYRGLADLLESRGTETGQFESRRTSEADMIRFALSGRRPEVTAD